MDIAQIMKQFNVTPDQVQNAWNTAKTMGAGVNTKEQALKLLKEKGIDNKALEKIGGYINSPMAGVVASVTGLNIDKVRQDFNSLLGGGGGSHHTVTPLGGSRLDKYKQGLRQL